MDKEATRSEIRLVAVAKTIQGHVVVEKDEVRVKAKARKVPEASLQAQRAVMPLQLRLLYINCDVNNDGAHYT